MLPMSVSSMVRRYAEHGMKALKPRGAVRLHRGDIMSPEKRSALMSRIRGRGTKPELTIASLLRASGILFEEHARDLPGRPDFVIRDYKIAIFVDGDFFHGWRFPLWRLKLSEHWENKIETNRRRDIRNHRKLRRMGWRVVRIWEHQIETNPSHCLMRVEKILTIDLASRRIA